ncbi:MAG: BamA/TamA family outer membrane protein [Gemmatimonadetes bacterium]|nr:BamA/TamA family outer membrane protein [Gemmatimonadota bacterium]
MVLPLAAWAQDRAPADEPGVVVRELSFEGNQFFDDYTLRNSIATTRSGFLARVSVVREIGAGERRYLDENEFRRDVLRVLLLYRIHGFPEAHVDTVVRRSAEGAFIRFLISEGRPIRVRSITIDGASGIVSTADLLHDLPLAVGDPFSRPRFQAAADTVRSVLRERGYPFVEVFRSYEVVADSLVADLAFDVVPGARAIIDTIMVEGTQRIGAEAVTRMLSVAPGRPYRQSDLYSSQRDLYGLGVFNFVNIALVDTVPGGPSDTTVGVRVQVAEARFRRLRAGAGYGTVDCFRALAAWTHSNAFGGGRALDVSGRVSKLGTGAPFKAGLENNLCGEIGKDPDTNRLKLNYNLTVTLREPHFFDRRTRAALSVSAERHSELRAFVREVVGGHVAITRRTRWEIPLTLTYALSYGRTVAEPAKFCVYLNVCRIEDTRFFTDPATQSTLTLGAVRDRANSVLDPSRGSTLTAEMRHSSRAIGSSALSQFTKGVVEFASYHALGRRTTFAWRVRVGAMTSPRVPLAKDSPVSDTVEFAPPAERFYGGGPTSVRGYAQNTLGPVVYVVDTLRGDSVEVPDPLRPGAVVRVWAPDTLTSPTGGNRMLIANAELRFPFLTIWGRSVAAAAFVDVGQVFEAGPDPVGVSQLRITPGFGLRTSSPLGPLRLDVAYNPNAPTQGTLYLQSETSLVELGPYPADPKPPDGFFRRLKFHFAVGQPF